MYEWRSDMQMNYSLLRTLLLAVAAGSVGYYLHAFRENSTTSLSVQRVAALDYYVSWESFSEVDEAKALLQAAATQIIQDLREQPGVGVFQVHTGPPSQKEEEERQLNRALTDLKERIEEFKGTEQELYLVQELLWILWREARHEDFVENYLRVLYQHPCHVLVGHFADKALLSSQGIGREQEIVKAFRHVTSIPLDFRARHQVRSVLNGNNLMAQIARPLPKSSL